MTKAHQVACLTIKRMGKYSALAILVVLAGLAQPSRAASPPHDRLTADLSTNLIRISSAFHGADVVVFGAIEQPGNVPTDVIAVVRGPLGEATVHRKDKIFGLWINHKKVAFAEAPSFYAVAASRPLHEITDETVLKSAQIGADYLQPKPLDPSVTEAERKEFTAALVADNVQKGRYQAKIGNVTFQGAHLYRANFHFPSNLPHGDFTVTVYGLEGGKIIASTSLALSVRAVGLTGLVAFMAENYPLYYGILAVILALVIGTIIPLIINRAQTK